MAGTEQAGTQAVARALDLLRVVAASPEPLTVADLTEISGLNRTTAWRLVSQLEASGFLTKLDSGGYVPGAAAMILGKVTTSRFGPLVRAALPVMRELREQANETVLLSVPHADGTMVVAQLDSPEAIRLRDYLYEVSPMLPTSPGKVILASYSEAEIDRILTQYPLTSWSGTPLDPDAVKAELVQARLDGYATVVDELSPGENGLAAPIIIDGHIIGCLDLCGPSFRFTPELMRHWAPTLKSSCTQIETLLRG